jgi:hypothetical protein
VANEMTVKVTRTVVRGTFAPPPISVSDRIDVSASKRHATTWAVGTTAEAMPTGDVGTLGRLFLHNRDTTNFVDFGPDSGGTLIPCVRLKPGEFAEFRLKPGVTYKGQADTGACDVDMELLSD